MTLGSRRRLTAFLQGRFGSGRAVVSRANLLKGGCTGRRFGAGRERRRLSLDASSATRPTERAGLRGTESRASGWSRRTSAAHPVTQRDASLQSLDGPHVALRLFEDLLCEFLRIQRRSGRTLLLGFHSAVRLRARLIGLARVGAAHLPDLLERGVGTGNKGGFDRGCRGAYASPGGHGYCVTPAGSASRRAPMVPVVCGTRKRITLASQWLTADYTVPLILLVFMSSYGSMRGRATAWHCRVPVGRENPSSAPMPL